MSNVFNLYEVKVMVTRDARPRITIVSATPPRYSPTQKADNFGQGEGPDKRSVERGGVAETAVIRGRASRVQ